MERQQRCAGATLAPGVCPDLGYPGYVISALKAANDSILLPATWQVICLFSALYTNLESTRLYTSVLAEEGNCERRKIFVGICIH